MIAKFKQFKRFRSLLGIEFENKFAYIGSAIIVLCSIWGEVYQNLNQYIDVLNSISNMLMGAYIGTLALIFSGVVFGSGLFTKKFEEDLIRYTGKEDVVDELFNSYLFLAFITICMIVGSMISIVLVNSCLPVPHFTIFYFCELVYVYFNLYIIGYFVGIINNTIELLRIRDKNISDKSFYERMNEIRIDIFLKELIRSNNTDEEKKKLRMLLQNHIDAMELPEEEKDKITGYFRKYYDL